MCLFLCNYKIDVFEYCCKITAFVIVIVTKYVFFVT